MQNDISPKSYGTAVALCGVFGTAGIHHFYLGDFWHGLADLTLLVLAVMFFVQGNDGLGIATLLADGVHTIVIFYLLITGQWRDGKGRIVAIPSTT